MRRLSLLALVSFLGACAQGNQSLDAGASSDASTQLDGGPQPECSADDPCDLGFICAAVAGVPRCMPDPNPPPPGDGTDCSPCQAPGECRQGVCVPPSSSGAFCEFDPECDTGQLCIAGRCSPDPRIPTPCATDGDCFAGLTCGPAGFCFCAFTTDCPSGLVCVEGTCTPSSDVEPCVADAECSEPGSVCDDGRCRPGTVCDIAAPDFAGRWNMQSELRLREALPDWLASFLDAVAGPLRFLAGDATCVDFGLPDWVEMEICDLVRPLIDEYVPAWVYPLARAIADLATVLDTWEIRERMDLASGDVPDAYRGTHTWESITFYYRGMPLTGTPETIRDWRFSPSPFNASAVCGTFHIDRHDVNVSIGSIIAWAVDVLVWAVTEGRYESLGDALGAATSGFCAALGRFAEDTVDYAGVGATVERVCNSQVRSLIDRALAELIEARIGASPITLRGQAPITGPSSLRPGQWYGTLLGSEFTGDFSADR